MGSINIFKPLYTFLYAAPLIILSNIHNFLRILGIKPEATESWSKYANHCALLTLKEHFCSFIINEH